MRFERAASRFFVREMAQSFVREMVQSFVREMAWSFVRKMAWSGELRSGAPVGVIAYPAVHRMLELRARRRVRLLAPTRPGQACSRPGAPAVVATERARLLAPSARAPVRPAA